MIVCITGPSGSGKSTLQEYLMKEFGYHRPLNFTTRKPRSDKELDEYVFLTKFQFHIKNDNGDFSETTTYNNHHYGITKYIDSDKVNVVVATPAGREIFREFASRRWEEFVEVYLTIEEKEMERRLGILRRESYTTIEERKNDLLWMSPTSTASVFDGATPTAELAERIDRLVQSRLELTGE